MGMGEGYHAVLCNDRVTNELITFDLKAGCSRTLGGVTCMLEMLYVKILL